jgi:hypothetical protein
LLRFRFFTRRDFGAILTAGIATGFSVGIFSSTDRERRPRVFRTASATAMNLPWKLRM